LVEFGGEVESAAGEVERVIGALTATESASDVAVETDVWEPVRRREAARRGRWTDELVEGGVLAPMRAASWLRDGRRAEDDLGASEDDCERVDGFVLIAGSNSGLWWHATIVQ